PKIQSKIPKYQKEAIKGVFDGERYKNFDIKKAEAALTYNYQYLKLKTPVIIVAENPLEQQLMFNFINSDLGIGLRKLIHFLYNKDLKNSQLRSQLCSQLNSQLRFQLGSE